MPYWLMKTEPEDYSWERLVAEGEGEWTGVRNHQAAANLRAMAVGDEAFFYRSVVQPAVIGIMRVSRAAYPDPTREEGPWVAVRIVPDRLLPQEVTLKAVKAEPRLAETALVRHSRLSVQPVSDAHWTIICGMAGDP